MENVIWREECITLFTANHWTRFFLFIFLYLSMSVSSSYSEIQTTSIHVGNIFFHVCQRITYLSSLIYLFGVYIPFNFFFFFGCIKLSVSVMVFSVFAIICYFIFLLARVKRSNISSLSLVDKWQGWMYFLDWWVLGKKKRKTQNKNTLRKQANKMHLLNWFRRHVFMHVAEATILFIIQIILQWTANEPHKNRGI